LRAGEDQQAADEDVQDKAADLALVLADFHRSSPFAGTDCGWVGTTSHETVRRLGRIAAVEDNLDCRVPSIASVARFTLAAGRPRTTPSARPPKT
jgi:hypothetical protein